MAIGELSAVAVLILALLHEQPMHPYQVHQTLVERGDTRLVRVNAGAVYHGVERLEKEGLVEAVGTERTATAPSGPRTGSPTPAGRRSPRGSRRFLGDDHPSYPLFPVGLAEAHEIPAETVVEQLTRRRDREAERMALLGRRHRTGCVARASPAISAGRRARDRDAGSGRRLARPARSTSSAPTRSGGASRSRSEFAEARHELKACQTPTA